MISLLTFIAGLGLYLTGINSISLSMQPIIGSKFRNFILKIADSDFKKAVSGILLGLLNLTSTSSTYTCIGLVKSNAISLKNAFKITAWSSVGVALILFISALDIKVIGLIFLGLIGLITFIGAHHHNKLKLWVPLLFSFGIFLLGLGLIKESAHILDHSNQLEGVLRWLSNKSVLYLVIGLIFTLICQTTSVASTLVLIYCSSGIIKFDDGMLMILGANLGYGFGLIYHVSHMESSAKKLGTFSALVKIIGTLSFLSFFLFNPNLIEINLDWLGAHENEMAFKIFFFTLMIQLVGVMLMNTFVERVEVYLNYLYPSKGSESLAAPKFIYPEALIDPDNAILLIEQEIQSLIETMPEYLDRIRSDSKDVNSGVTISEVHRANLIISQKINEFIDQLSLLKVSDESTHKTFQIQEMNEKVHAILESIYKFIEILGSLKGEQNSLCTSLTEGLHLSLTMLKESNFNEPDDFLMELTSDKSALIQSVKKQLVADDSIDLNFKQTILGAISLFERVSWLINQIERSKR